MHKESSNPIKSIRDPAARTQAWLLSLEEGKKICSKAVNAVVDLKRVYPEQTAPVFSAFMNSSLEVIGDRSGEESISKQTHYNTILKHIYA